MIDPNDSRRHFPDVETATRFQVTAGVAAIRSAPQPDAEMLTQALHGETVLIAYEENGFGRVQVESDGYVGWTDMEALSAPALPPTHRVSALRSYVFSDPDLKSAPRYLVSLNAKMVVEQTKDRFAYCARAGWIPLSHLVPIGTYEKDPANVAERYLGSPYLWGGKESLGLDCSGLVQMAFGACGVDLPRDSDMQWNEAGDLIPDWQLAGTLRRNDLIFWEHHVGIMLDNETLLHANAFHMSVVKEPLAEAIPRITDLYADPIGAKRISFEESGD